MVQAFIQYIEQETLFTAQEKILLAVSGGLDSVVMAHLFHQAGFNFGIAHCNFQLRGTDADEDAIFVQQLAQRLGVPFFLEQFDTLAISQTKQQSIQLVARELRYGWLENTRQQFGFQYIATAHHQLDQVETVLLNLVKGCGIRGLHGIPLKRGLIIRPMLFSTKAEILAYAKDQDIQYREDASNAETKYDRNLVRLKVIPALQKLNPSLEKTFHENIQRFIEIEKIYQNYMTQWRSEHFKKEHDLYIIDMNALRNVEAANTILYECLRPFGFNSDQCRQILKSVGQSNTGRRFNSISHEALLDRGRLLIREKTKKEQASKNRIWIESGNQDFEHPSIQLEFKTHHQKPSEIPRNQAEAWLDLEKLSFPLVLRKWEPGDKFAPLGMPGQHRKLQDFFSDLKLSQFEKEEIWLLESEGNILWIVGLRIADWAKITPQTTKCLQIKLKR